ncbi:MAG: hypothetical protein NC394_04875 [Bacteroides sp.]|nr:hypothetical protein [Bacteroides sp.]
MFTSAEYITYDRLVPIIIAFFIAVTVLAVNIAGRKRKWYELITLAVVLGGFVILISFNITEITMYPKHPVYGIGRSFFLQRYSKPFKYAAVLLFNLFFYSASSFYSALVSETTLKKLMLKNTVLFVPLNIVFFLLLVSNIVSPTYFDPVSFAEIYIGSWLGFAAAAKIKKFIRKRWQYDKDK